VRWLWATERTGIFTKGLTARMTSSVIYSVAVITGYESVKRWSVYDEYKDRVRW
jgi:solute carrier family 25 protein 44